MQTRLPPPDTRCYFVHPAFDEFYQAFKPHIDKFYKPCKDDLFVMEISAEVQFSDIKWNDFAGTLQGMVYRNGYDMQALFKARIYPFTGNCGVKSFSHLFVYTPHGISTEQWKAFDPIKKQALKFLESFLFHRTNCGYVIGSDSVTGGKTHASGTRDLIKYYGDNWKFSPAIWNPNYTWDKHHKIDFFYKNLLNETYVNYWTSAFNKADNKAISFDHEEV